MMCSRISAVPASAARTLTEWISRTAFSTSSRSEQHQFFAPQTCHRPSKTTWTARQETAIRWNEPGRPAQLRI
jgi:hypothetical protein